MHKAETDADAEIHVCVLLLLQLAPVAAAAVTGDWRRCRVHVNVDVEFTSAIAAGSAISQHVANRLSPARPHTVRRLKPSVNCIQINGPRQRDLAMSKAA